VAGAPQSSEKPNLFQELVQPFIDVVRAPRALWGVNLGYFLEGLVYFGVLGYLAMYFSDHVFQGVPEPDVWAHNMVAVLTGGITLSMFFLGFVADRKGVRFALLAAFVLLLLGRALISAAPTVFGMEPQGPWSPLHLTTMAGILIVVVGYGMYQPAAYAAVRQFTTPKTAGMGFAMLYALMNLGGYLPTYAFLLREEKHLGLGIPGTFWVYTALTTIGLLTTFFILTRRTVAEATTRAKEETARIQADEAAGKSEQEKQKEAAAAAAAAAIPDRTAPPVHLWVFMAGVIALLCWRLPETWSWAVPAAVAAAWLVSLAIPPARRWLAIHPLADGKFFFFIFALIPVQTLFTYNWLVLPQYINRAYDGWIGEKFEIAANFNPLLIFVAVPVIAALTQKRKVYNMMILGTFVMSAPAVLLALGPTPFNLFTYLVIMTIGEAMWQPRFLQYAAEIAPEGRTGVYMGVAQLPWFLTKVLVPILYSGYMMDKYVPKEGPQDSEAMWLIYGFIAISSTILLIIARPWIGKDFKTKA
jgi:MFS family permease